MGRKKTMFKCIWKKDFFPNNDSVLIKKKLSGFINITLINKDFYLYNGTFFLKRFVFFFFLKYKLSDFVLTKKFKKAKP